jgi:hypothetical protein
MSATAAAVVPAPGFGQPQPGQQRSTARPEQVRGRTRPPEGQQRGMDPVLERDPVTDKMQPPPSSLPLRPHRRGRQPDRRDQIAAGKLSQHPRVDPVGLAGQWGQALDRLPSAIRTSHPASSSWSCTNRAPFIDSIAATTGSPSSASCRARPAPRQGDGQA